ncbi:MAG: ATP-binding cassette domain-containing protein [Thermodesulfobacteriota bacterium]
MIQVENLTRYYDDVCAVNHINLNIQQGEILGLLGPNGAGKTTTLRMLTGFLRPTSGSIRVRDLSVDTDMLAIKRLMGYLPESAPLYPDMLVYDYLDYVAGLRGVDRSKRLDRIRAMADMCALGEVMHQPVAELSKGYKQRVGLAHALINDPEVLVLDEPTSGLDPNQIVEIRDIIRRIGQAKTIIFSTHILSEAEATCDRIVIIDKGKIVADEPTAALKQKASQDYYIHLTLTGAVMEAVRPALAEVREVSDIREAPPAETGQAAGELRLQLRCRAGSDPRREIYARIRRQDWDLLEFYSETPSLENIFRKLTRES